MPNCLECNAPFERTRTAGRQQIYCTKTCRLKRLYRHPDDVPGASRDRICDRCGKPFVQSKRHQRFCSKQCYLGAWTRENKERAAERSRKRRRDKPDWYKERHGRYYLSSRVGLERVRPWHYVLKSAKQRAKASGITFDLTDAWAEARWTGECEVTGLEFWKNDGPGPSSFSCTLDRIVGSKGYTLDNCRFVCWAFNGLKGSGTDEEALIVATALVKKLGIFS